MLVGRTGIATQSGYQLVGPVIQQGSHSANFELEKEARISLIWLSGSIKKALDSRSHQKVGSFR